jgi:hypothetical protein
MTEEPKKDIKAVVYGAKKNKVIVVCGENKFEVDANPGQMITVWKLGDPSRGWIPNKRHLDEFMNALQVALKETEGGGHGHLVCHYGVSVEQVRI